MLSIDRVDVDHAPPVTDYSDYTVFQTKEWLKFISQTQDAETVVAAVTERGVTVGRFCGLIVKKFGLRILGSPFPGWTTSYMGFNLHRSVSRTDALQALREFAFRKMKCAHLEIRDRHVTAPHLREAGYFFEDEPFSGFEIDLTNSEERLLAAMDSACRRCIRKSTKEGVRVEPATDASFANEYYVQLEDVFAKQGLVPTYSVTRVATLIECLAPTGQLLLLRARNSEGKCIATGIFPAANDTMYFWGGASWRSFQHLRPNEAIQWFAMQYWKAKNITKYDMGGRGDYKRKYGGYEISVPSGRESANVAVHYLRGFGKSAFAMQQRLLGWAKH